MASPVSVISTIARASLGIRYDTPFQEGEHLETDKFWNEDENTYWAKGQMEWYLRKVRQESATRWRKSGRIPKPQV